MRRLITEAGVGPARVPGALLRATVRTQPFSRHYFKRMPLNSLEADINLQQRFWSLPGSSLLPSSHRDGHNRSISIGNVSVSVTGGLFNCFGILNCPGPILANI